MARTRRATRWLLALTLAACSPVSAEVDVHAPSGEGPPLGIVEPPPESTTTTTLALAQLELELRPGESNLLDSAVTRGILGTVCSLRLDARARLRVDGGDVRVRGESMRDKVEYPVLAWDPEGEGPVRVLDTSSDVAFAMFVERSDLAPRVRESALLLPPEPDALARMRLSAGAVVDVSREAFDAGEERVPARSWVGAKIRFSGALRREDLALVTHQIDFDWLEITHWTTGERRDLRTAPAPDAALVAELDARTYLAILAEPNAEGWAEVVAFEEGIAAQGFIRESDYEPAMAYGSGGLGMVGTGRGGGSWLVVPVDAPLFDAPQGELVGRTLDDTSLRILEVRGGWTSVAVESDWGELAMWVEIAAP